MSCPACGKNGIHTCSPQYAPQLEVFLRTYNIAYELDGKMYEVQIKAKNWDTAEAMLIAIRNTGVIYKDCQKQLELF